MRLTAGQHRDQVPTGDGTHQGNSHVKELGLHGMGDRGRESTPGGGSPSSGGRRWGGRLRECGALDQTW